MNYLKTIKDLFALRGNTRLTVPQMEALQDEKLRKLLHFAWEALLTAKELTKTYPGAPEPVLNAVSAAFYPGEFAVIMGPSGAGKSTLLYALSGMDPADAGQVLYKGQELGALSEKGMAQLRAKEFGFVFQQTHLVSNLSLYENVLVAGFLDKERPEKETRERAGLLLDRMDLTHVKDRLPSQVSGGEAQRAAIARAVINRPGLLFADEPTGALNRKNSQEVLDLLTALNRAGQSILMVTHDIRAAIRGSRVLYLEDGRIVDELPLPPYEEATAKDREEQVNRWLTSMAW